MDENKRKAEEIRKLIQSKGAEVQNKIESEVASALKNYSTAVRNIRRDFFENQSSLKQRVTDLHKESAIVRQNKIITFQKALTDDLENAGNQKKTKINYQIEVSKDFPIQTRHYIAKNSNIKIDVSSTYNLFNLWAFKQVDKPLEEPVKKSIVRPQAKKDMNNEVKDLEKHKLNFICRYLIRNVSSSSTVMVIFAKLIGKQPDLLTKFWLRLTKGPKVKSREGKIFAFKNTQYFCTICKKYVCNLHYEEAVVPDGEEAHLLNKEPDFEYDPFTTRYLVAYSKELTNKEEDEKAAAVSKRKNKDVGLTTPYHVLYKCPPKLQNSCHLKMSRSDNRALSFSPEGFTKYESEYILNYCLKYGWTNPCAIRLLLNNQKECWEIDAFIRSSSKSNLPEELIAKAKADKKPESKFNKRTNTHTVSNLWKHYIPCYHPGESCKNCTCHERGICEVSCGCTKDCPMRFQGCNCKPGKCQTVDCNCWRNNRECDPELCKGCRCDINIRLAKKKNLKTPICNNTNITYKYKPRLLLAKSTVCDGMGIFAGQNFQKGDYIGEYVGEMIDYLEGEYRSVIYSDLGCSYMFDYEEDIVTNNFYMIFAKLFLDIGFTFLWK